MLRSIIEVADVLKQVQTEWVGDQENNQLLY